ncbi:MotE family protein [Acetobacter orientalis]|uniref:MotE family protein n=1 Tax=Acetobacter orientalis TaxID=146474 RepID=UPI0039EBBA57
MLIPRLSFGKLVNMSSSLMVLLLAINVHSIVSALWSDDANAVSPGLVSPAKAASATAHDVVPPPAAAPDSTNASSQVDKNAAEGWMSVPTPDLGDGKAGSVSAENAASGQAAPEDCANNLGCGHAVVSATGEVDPAVKRAEADLIKDILAHQSEMGGQQKEIAAQQKVLDAAKAALDVRMNDLDASLAQLKQKQEAQRAVLDGETDRLVKIYEDMPPKEAAAVFNIMDLHVLVAVSSRMNTRKISAIMGNMSPERVNLISQYMAGIRSFKNTAPETEVKQTASTEQGWWNGQPAPVVPAQPAHKVGAPTLDDGKPVLMPAFVPAKPSRQ